MPAGAFKARCLAVMKQVQATGEPVVVTRRGTPVVKVVPVEPANDSIFGFMRGKLNVVGDIESPIPLDEWKIFKIKKIKKIKKK
ncbi:MAG: type II toxin-antitoxin system prevent-host-death family antitoxin [Candidatus Acidiferrum sp.]